MLVVMATGDGKNMLFVLPAAVEDGRKDPELHFLVFLSVIKGTRLMVVQKPLNFFDPSTDDYDDDIAYGSDGSSSSGLQQRKGCLEFVRMSDWFMVRDSYGLMKWMQYLRTSLANLNRCLIKTRRRITELTRRDQHDLNALRLRYKFASRDLVFMLRHISVAILRLHSRELTTSPMAKDSFCLHEFV
jgi:hypothetical protein